jgi:hypothetical protein
MADHNKSKDEIAKEMEIAYETTRQRKFVKDVLWPWLIKNSKSIDDAKNMVYATNLAIEQTFNVRVGKEQTRLSEVPLKELNMSENIKQDEEFARDRELLAMFDNESVAIASSLLKGAKLAIESFEREESTKRPLSELPATLLE